MRAKQVKNKSAGVTLGTFGERVAEVSGLSGLSKGLFRIREALNFSVGRRE